jgi:hypothetical protein
MMAAPVTTTGGTLTIGPPQALFQSPVRLNSVTNQYAVSADGQRFLVSVPTENYDTDPFRILLNWRTTRGASDRRTAEWSCRLFARWIWNTAARGGKLRSNEPTANA